MTLLEQTSSSYSMTVTTVLLQQLDSPYHHPRNVTCEETLVDRRGFSACCEPSLCCNEDNFKRTVVGRGFGCSRRILILSSSVDDPA